MSDIIATVELKSSSGVQLRQLWVSITNLAQSIQPIALTAQGKGQIQLTVGTAYYLFYQFYGNPGDTISVKITSAGKTLLELKESKITSGSYQAGVRELTP